MKKIRLIIILIYLSFIFLITILTIILTAQIFIRGNDLYFKELNQPKIEFPSDKEIKKTIDLLKELKIL